MRALKIPLIIISSFAIGFVLYFLISNLAGKPSDQSNDVSRKPLRLLAYKNLFPKAFLAQFSERSGIRVELTEAANPEELWSKLETERGKFDLVSLYSYQIPLASQMSKTSPVQRELLPEIDRVSADFLNIPGEIGHSRVVPLLWGITGFAVNREKKISKPFSLREYFQINQGNLGQGNLSLLSSTADLHFLVTKVFPEVRPGSDQTPQLLKNIQNLIARGQLSDHFASPGPLLESSTSPDIIQMSHGEAALQAKAETGKTKWDFIIPQEGAHLWILSLALVQDTSREESAYAFLRYALEPEAALELSRTNRQATTHLALEDSSLPKELKASYLREIPLMRYRIWQDFSRAREIRDAIKGSSSGSRP